jgi:UDP-N-acetylglucosamine pyrophosphorylase
VDKEHIALASSLKMRKAGVSEPAIAAFEGAIRRFLDGDRGMLPESCLGNLGDLPRYADLDPVSPTCPDIDLWRQVAVIKLNGGLGTSMGLDRAKSLIRVKDDLNFLDIIARQILRFREQTGSCAPAFLLMNSFNTRKDSMDYLSRYPELAASGRLDFLQSMVPKLDASSLSPVSFPMDASLEWCPPGHGDLYPTLLSTGLLDQMLANGIRYLFVSNSDNLGATLDPRIASYFATSGNSFLMEVTDRTEADRKGGHLTRRRGDGRLVLRESAQVLKEDETAFQDIAKHRFFNTNNVWIRLDHLRELLAASNGFLPLPLIRNVKTVDPRDASSHPVIQLESAMGAAIECFEKSSALVVPRTRFAPVKTTSDLLLLRSDAYVLEDRCSLALHTKRAGRPPVVILDPVYYKALDRFERLFVNGTPSLLECDRLSVLGQVAIDPGVVCVGSVEFVNAQPSDLKAAPAGVYRNRSVTL